MSIVEVELTPEQKRFLQQRRELRLSQKLKREVADHKSIDLFNQEKPLKIFQRGQESGQIKLGKLAINIHDLKPRPLGVAVKQLCLF